MLSTLEPRVSKKSHAFSQFTFDLPHRVHCSKYYPISPDPIDDDKHASTASVVVFGHDQGVTFLWRGFKVQEKAVEVPQEPEQNPKILQPQTRGSRKRAAQAQDENTGRRRRLRRDVNNSDETEDIRMVEAPAPIETEHPKLPPPFSTPHEQQSQRATHSQTIHLGAAVHDISFLPSTILTTISPHISTQAPVEVPDDGNIPLSTRLLKNHMVIAVICSDNSTRLISLPLLPTPFATPQIQILSSISGHRTLPTAVALTLVPSRPKPDQARTGLSGAPSYEFLVASVSPDISGRLLLWRVALTTSQSQPRSSTHVEFIKPAAPRTVSLSYPALHISFNPSSSSSLSRHNLLLADINGGLRIYDTDKNQWLLALYMDYPPHGQTRKKILGANWCMDGQALVVLGGDGEWGVFELNGKGKFLSCGKIGETLDPYNARKRYGPGGSTIFSGSSTASSSTGGGTSIGNRSIRSAFSLSISHSSYVQPQLTKGKLAITIFPGSRSDLFADITPKGNTGDNEMLVLDYDNQLVLIPSLQETVAAKKRDNGEKTRTFELKDVVLGGEDVTSLDIRWLVSKRTIASQASKSRPQSRNSNIEDVFGRPTSRRSTLDESDVYDEEDSYYINDFGDVIHGKRPPPEGEKWLPKVQVVVGAGCRLNTLEIQDDMLDMNPTSKALVVPKTGFVPGLAARVGVGLGMGLGFGVGTTTDSSSGSGAVGVAVTATSPFGLTPPLPPPLRSHSSSSMVGGSNLFGSAPSSSASSALGKRKAGIF